MKETVFIHSYLVEASEVGNWEGQELLVADNLNRIYHQIYDIADYDIETERLTAMLESVWPQWQHNPELLELDDEMIDAFVDALYDHFNPEPGQDD